MAPLTTPLLSRLAAGRLAQACRVMPVVVLMGARQTGKSTLVRESNPDEDRSYLTLESRSVLERALDDPGGFVTQREQLTIDEVQRAPELLLAIKTAVDAERQATPGRFILTGSANLLLMRGVNETLAGRASYLTIWPMTRREQLGLGTAGLWDDLLATPRAQWRDLVEAQPAPFEDWRALASRGGYPRPAVHLRDRGARAEWFEGYVNTYLERDIPDLSPIANRPDFRRLTQMAALRVGGLVNQTQIARDASIPQTTVQRYLNLLETSYQIVRLQPYAVSRTKRLIKTPKLYWSDPALALHLGGETVPRGEHLENIVAHDLLAWRQTQAPTPQILYWRTTSGREVDFVIEAGRTLLPIEVKTTQQPSSGDLASLRAFMDEYGDRAVGGLLLYGGEETFWVAKEVLAAPWWKVV